MNTFIIQKCLDEISKEKPDLSYIKGILETLIVMSGVSVSAPIQKKTEVINTPTIPLEEVDEVLNKYTNGPIGRITN